MSDVMLDLDLADDLVRAFQRSVSDTGTNIVGPAVAVGTAPTGVAVTR
jgi:hypothetical protein